MRDLGLDRGRFLFLARYIVSGIISALIPIAFLYIWVSVLGLESLYLLGVVLGFLIALAVAFLLQKFWAFRDREAKGASLQLLSYSAVAVSGLALNALLLIAAKAALEWLGLDFFSGWYLLAQAASIAVVAAVNFTLNFLFTFRRARRERLWESP
jgi:putative flippase GtrA